jgi:hypothetical protein
MLLNSCRSLFSAISDVNLEQQQLSDSALELQESQHSSSSRARNMFSPAVDTPVKIDKRLTAHVSSRLLSYVHVSDNMICFFLFLFFLYILAAILLMLCLMVYFMEPQAVA